MFVSYRESAFHLKMFQTDHTQFTYTSSEYPKFVSIFLLQANKKVLHLY